MDSLCLELLAHKIGLICRLWAHKFIEYDRMVFGSPRREHQRRRQKMFGSKKYKGRWLVEAAPCGDWNLRRLGPLALMSFCHLKSLMNARLGNKRLKCPWGWYQITRGYRHGGMCDRKAVYVHRMVDVGMAVDCNRWLGCWGPGAIAKENPRAGHESNTYPRDRRTLPHPFNARTTIIIIIIIIISQRLETAQCRCRRLASGYRKHRPRTGMDGRPTRGNRVCHPLTQGLSAK